LVTITGTKFTGVTAVKFGSTNATEFTVNSETSITAVSPAGTPGTVFVTVTSPEGTSATSSADQFFYHLPRYKKNGVFLTEGALGKTFIQGWGTLKLFAVGPDVSYVCRDAEGGYIENPVGGGAGVGAIELYSSYQCTFSSCINFPTVLAEALPWPEVLEEPFAGEIRVKTTGIKQHYQCWETKAAFERAARGEGESPLFFYVFCCGELKPKVQHGTSATTPGFEEFNSTAGKLEGEGSGGSIFAETEGKIKVLGYERQELINVE
jgi:hypothetical protein